MVDIFREVDEAVREDRAKRLWRRYGSMAATLAVLVVLGTAGYVWWQNDQLSQRHAGTAALAAALSQGGEAAVETADALSNLASTAADGLSTVARLYEAALLANANQTDVAIDIYDQVAADTEVDTLWRDFALLMAVQHRVDNGDPAALIAQLDPLTGADNPWRFTASEMVALLAVRQGDTTRAAEIFAELATDAFAPPGIRQRAGELADWLGAE